ncbi:Uncharacterised protein [Chlamydia trachomatis]|nr:Uncharacterised protein [Chlamydia trachomatis]
MSGWAAAAKVGGDILNSALGLYSSSKAWRRQREAAQNAHQWEVADLRKAGLNPILSATGGSGASAGSASVPAGLGVDVGGALSTAQNIENAKHTNDLIDSQKATQGELQKTEREKQSMLYNQSWLLAETAKQMSNTNYVPNMYTARLQKNPKLRENAIDAFEAKHWREGYGDLGGLTGIGKAVESSVRNLFR